MIPKPDTLDLIYQLPQRRVLDVSARPLKPVHDHINRYLDACTLVNPLNEAVNFYTLNHLVAILQQKFSRYEKLPAFGVKIVDEYAGVVSNQVLRFAIYLMMICMRESRHDQSQESKHVQGLHTEFGDEAFDFIRNKIGAVVTGGINPPTAIQYFRGHKFKDCTLGQFFGCVLRVFERGNFGSSFGGYRWVTCGKPLHDWITGRISGEALVDVGYTLAHNGGPIFNKGMTYENAPGSFRQVLDVQRAGYMPELVMTGEAEGENFSLDLEDGWTKSPLAALVREVKKAFPDSIADTVDGNAVAKTSTEIKDKIKAAEIEEKAELNVKKHEFLGTEAPEGVPFSFKKAGPISNLKVPDHGLHTGFYDVMPGYIASTYSRIATTVKTGKLKKSELEELLGI